MVKIAFHTPLFCVRGTSVAIWDYAHYNEEILKNQSVIILPEEGIFKSDVQATVHFASRFSILTYKKGELDNILKEEKCDILYCIKYGKNDEIYSKQIKTVIHCVFDMSEPHGDIYAGVSNAIAKKFNKELFVPHMIGLKPENNGNLRNALKIPDNAIVFGRYGGQDTFNILFCWRVIQEILDIRKDIFFLFINTPQNVVHKNIFYLSNIVENKDKNIFIETCDAYLECGTLGHSFGLAIGEFSVHNKPIIAYKSEELWNTSHIEILGNKGIYYENQKEFYNILNNFNPNDYKNKDLNCYKDYSPEKVMQIFKKVFIDK